VIGLPRAAPGPAPRRIRRWLRGLAVVPALGLAGTATWWAMQPPAIAVVHPSRGPAVQAVYATGTVEPTVMVPISAHGTARLVELDADEGSRVVKGAVLARLEDDDLRRTIDETRAEERYAKAELDRAANLVQRQIVAHSVFDRARADWEKAKAAADRAAVQADFLQLMAPADGVVIRRDGEIGQLIAANQTVFWMSCCAPLRLSAEVDEEDIALVRSGQEVLIRTDDLPGQVFHGTVLEVTPKGDPVARSFRVRVGLPADTPLLIGMTTETNIVLRRADEALLVPAAAVLQDRVWTVVDGRLVSRTVRTGAKGTSSVEILDGIGDGDWIVAAASPDLKAGERVRPAPP
jgi:RND family efflux transporter MFP subunit